MTDPLYIVFEQGGLAYVYETLDEVGRSIESIDLDAGHYVGTFSDQGEVIEMRSGDLWVEFQPSGRSDPAALASAIRGSLSYSELFNDPRQFAIAVLRSS